MMKSSSIFLSSPQIHNVTRLWALHASQLVRFAARVVRFVPGNRSVCFVYLLK